VNGQAHPHPHIGDKSRVVGEKMKIEGRGKKIAKAEKEPTACKRTRRDAPVKTKGKSPKFKSRTVCAGLLKIYSPGKDVVVWKSRSEQEKENAREQRTGGAEEKT